MSKIIGVTVGTPMSVPKIKEKLNMTADEVKFSDGETFQQKYDSGELKGSDGQPGKDGSDGKTPVKGTDYWTAADKAAMVNDVLAALPTWTGGSY